MLKGNYLVNNSISETFALIAEHCHPLRIFVSTVNSCYGTLSKHLPQSEVNKEGCTVNKCLISLIVRKNTSIIKRIWLKLCVILLLYWKGTIERTGSGGCGKKAAEDQVYLFPLSEKRIKKRKNSLDTSEEDSTYIYSAQKKKNIVLTFLKGYHYFASQPEAGMRITWNQL